MRDAFSQMLRSSAILFAVALLPAFSAGTLLLATTSIALADDDGDDGGGGGGGAPGGAGGGGGTNTGAEGAGGGGNDWRVVGRERRRGRAEPRFRWPWEQQAQRARPRAQAARQRVPVLRERPRRPVEPRPIRAASRPPVVAAAPVPRIEAIPRELVLAGVSEASLAALRVAGFRVIAERPTRGGARLARVRVPSDLSMRRALTRAREIAPEAVADRNHVYRAIYRVQSGATPARRAFADPLGAVAWPERVGCLDGASIALIDTGIDTAHPAFAGRALEVATTRSDGRAASAPTHATALALIVLGDGRTRGLAPDARLLAIDAFHRSGGQDIADAFDLAAALDLAGERGVAVVNLSLAGPENAAVDAAGKALAERGVRVVAAVGNDGPAAGPRFPAAHPWAIAVTAVDADNGAYARAVRGEHVGFAAPGVRLNVLDARGRERFLTGTSFATPFVALALAARGEPHGERLARLAEAASDLGAPGRDTVFGHGLLRFAGVCAP